VNLQLKKGLLKKDREKKIIFFSQFLEPSFKVGKKRVVSRDVIRGAMPVRGGKTRQYFTGPRAQGETREHPRKASGGALSGAY
jgi:hypothetical protein